MLLSTKSFWNKKPSNGVGKYLTISHSHMTIFCLAPLCANILTALPQFFLSFTHGATNYLIVLVWWPNILSELPWVFFSSFSHRATKYLTVLVWCPFGLMQSWVRLVCGTFTLCCLLGESLFVAV